MGVTESNKAAHGWWEAGKLPAWYGHSLPTRYVHVSGAVLLNSTLAMLQSYSTVVP